MFWFFLFTYVLSCFSHVWLFATLWTVGRQAPLSIGILQARILEWVAMPSSKESSQPRNRIQVSHTAGGFFTSWTTREAPQYFILWLYLKIRSLKMLRWVPIGEGGRLNQYDCGPYKKVKSGHRCMKGKHHVKMKAVMEVTHLQVKKCQLPASHWQPGEQHETDSSSEPSGRTTTNILNHHHQ